MATPDIEVLVGVLGGFSIASGSGKLIHNQIEGIIRQTQSRVKLQINIDKAYFKKQVEAALKSIQWTPNVNPPAGGGGNGSGAGGRGASDPRMVALREIAALQERIERKRLSLVGKEGTAEAERLNEQLVKAEQLMTSLRNNFVTNGYGSTADIDAYVGAQRRVVAAVEAVEVAQGRAADRSERNILNQTLGYDKLAAKVSQYINNIASTAYRDPKMFAELQTLLSNITLRRGDVKTLADDFEKLKVRLRSAGLEAETLGQKMIRVFSEKFGYAVMATLAASARRALRAIYTNVVSVDTAMTELKKVTDETAERYNRFLDEAADRANRLGATLADTVSATADFARLGFSIGEASQLADAALVYKNVGDGIDDISVASESIISTMQGFGIAASDAMTIVDKFNEVGNNFAISSAGIGEALTRSSAAMNAAGNSIDETIALVTAANTVLQNPDVVGTTMKTMSMYLRAAKSDLESAGEDTEGMAESVSELRKEILALTGKKVDIQRDDDSFKNTYQILKELSRVWDDLTDVSKANILETIAGKRNANAAAAILENFEIAERVLLTSQRAAGSALAENEKYLDSINGKIAVMQASYQEFSENVLGSEIVKGFIGGVTTLIAGLNELNDVTGGISSNLLTLSAGFAALTLVVTALNAAFVRLFQVNIVGSITSWLADYNKASIGATLSTMGLSKATMGWIGVAAMAIMIAAKLYDAAVESTKELEDKLRDSREELSAAEGELETISHRIKELEELGSLTLTEEGELRRLKEQRRELEVTKNILEQMNQSNAVAYETAKLNDFDRGKVFNLQDGAVHAEGMQSYFDEISDYDAQIVDARLELGQYDVGTKEFDRQTRKIEKLEKAREKAYGKASHYIATLESESENITGATDAGRKYLDFLTNLKIQYDKLDGSFNVGDHAIMVFGKYEHEDAKEQLDELRESAELTGDVLFNLYSGESNDAIVDLVNDLIELGIISDATPEQLQKLIDALYGVEEASNAGYVSLGKFSDDLKKMGEEFDGLADAYRAMGDSGKLTADQLEKLLEDYPDLLADINTENGMLKISRDVLKEKFEVQKAEKIQALQDSKDRIEGLKKEAEAQLEVIRLTLIQAAANKTVNSSIRTAISDFDTAYDSGVNNSDYQSYESLISQYEKDLSEIEQRIKVIESFSIGSFTSKESSSSTDKFKQNLEKQAKILQHHREMDKITAEEYYNGLEEILKQYKTNTVKYAEEIADLEQQIFNGRRELFADLTADRQYHADRMIMAGDYEQAKAINQAILEDTKKQIDAAIEYGLDENSDYVQELRKQAADAGKAMLDAITESFDQFMSYADDFNVWKDLDFTKLEYLEKLLNDIDALYLKGAISWKEYVEAHNNVAKQVYDLQKDSIETIIDMTMEMIEQEAEDKIDALEKQKDAYQDIIDLKKKELNIGKEQDNHDREVEEKIRNIARLRSRIAQLELDDSREAQAEKAALEEELYQEEKELADLQSDYALDKTVETLDESAEAFEDAKDEEIRVIEESVDTWAEVYELAIDRIDNDFENLYEDLNDWMAIHRDSIDGPDSLKTSWETVLGLKREYANLGIEDIYDQAGADIALNPGAPDDPEAKAILENMKQNSVRAKQEGTSLVDIDGDGKKENLHQMNKDLANDYYELTGQKLYYNNGWRYDNENGDFVYDVSDVKRNPTTGGGTTSGGASAGSKSEYGDKYLATVAKFDEPPSGVIAKGSTNTNGVKWIQYFLQQTGHFKNSVDGVFWDKLQYALEEFQDENDIPADGKYGPQTLAKMKKYHTGGVVDGTGAINDHEVLALLEKGELVLDDKKKSNLKLMFAKIGNMIEWASAASAIANVRNPVPGKAASSGDTWAPNFDVTIHHNGNMTDADAKRYGRQIGNEALEQLRIAFNKRGK